MTPNSCQWVTSCLFDKDIFLDPVISHSKIPCAKVCDEAPPADQTTAGTITNVEVDRIVVLGTSVPQAPVCRRSGVQYQQQGRQIK
jgi:hypothetical protein